MESAVFDNLAEFLDLLKQIDKSGIQADFREEEYEKLIDQYKKGELNQFGLFISKRVLEKKKITLPYEEMLTFFTSQIADNDKVITRESEIRPYIDLLYKILMFQEIVEIKKNKF